MARRRYAAVVVGINEYRKRSGLAALGYAQSDADLVCRTLQRCGFESIRQLIGKSATSSRLLSEFDRLAEKADHGAPPFDLALVYFAGHGSSGRSSRHWLHMVDASATDPVDRPVGSIEVQTLISRLLELPARQHVVVIDACRNRRAGEDSPRFDASFYQLMPRATAALAPRAITVEPVAVITGVHVLLGCGPEQVSWEAEEMRQGLFTKCLCDQLEQAAGMISLDALHRNVVDSTRNWCETRGLKPAQTPELYSPSPSEVWFNARPHGPKKPKPSRSERKAEPVEREMVRVGTDRAARFHTIRDAVRSTSGRLLIELAPGAHREAVILDKDVTVRGDGQHTYLEFDRATVLCVQDGEVALFGLVIERSAGNPSGPAVEVTGGALAITQCDLASKGPVVITAINPHAEIALRGPGKVDGAQHRAAGVTVRDGARISAADIEFVSTSGAAIDVRGAETEADVDRCRFTGFKGAAVVARDGATAAIKGSRFMSGKGPAVRVEDGGFVRLEQCRVECDGGPAVEVMPGGRAEIAECDFEGDVYPLAFGPRARVMWSGNRWNGRPVEGRVS